VLCERLGQSLELELSDTSGAWELQGDGVWQRRVGLPGALRTATQETFMRRALRAYPVERIHRLRSADD
jgi:hypothetical protein